MSAHVGALAALDRLIGNTRTMVGLTGDPRTREHLIEGEQARAAVAELIACSGATVRAFEALGNASGVISNLEAHRECERALIEQKAALARVGGAS